MYHDLIPEGLDYGWSPWSCIDPEKIHRYSEVNLFLNVSQIFCCCHQTKTPSEPHKINQCHINWYHFDSNKFHSYKDGTYSPKFIHWGFGLKQQHLEMHSSCLSVLGLQDKWFNIHKSCLFENLREKMQNNLFLWQIKLGDHHHQGAKVTIQANYWNVNNFIKLISRILKM